jgi:hypothetical protein
MFSSFPCRLNTRADIRQRVVGMRYLFFEVFNAYKGTSGQDWRDWLSLTTTTSNASLRLVNSSQMHFTIVGN